MHYVLRNNYIKQFENETKVNEFTLKLFLNVTNYISLMNSKYEERETMSSKCYIYIYICNKQ